MRISLVMPLKNQACCNDSDFPSIMYCKDYELSREGSSLRGKLAPLVIPHGLTSGTGLMNPSIFIDDKGQILVNLRHVNYTLYHAENEQKFPSRFGLCHTCTLKRISA